MHGIKADVWPSAAVQTMLSDGLIEIHEANPQMTIVMTAGNHDSGTKHANYAVVPIS